MKSLWGDEFDSVDAEDVLEKVKNPKKAGKKVVLTDEQSFNERIAIIRENVMRVLGHRVNDIEVIRTRERLHDYISHAILNNIIAVDTETNNTTEVITCKIMGPCIYTPGEKSVYIPINHVDFKTRERLPNQLTEQDIHEEFQRLVDAKTKILMHNATFDIKVISLTCAVELTCYWDTRNGARVYDENASEKDKSNLKYQYRVYIDPTQEKYDIESLFEGLEYAIIPIDLFALYAGNDPYMTYMLYEFQRKEFEKPENERMYKMFLNVEMKEIPVVKDIETVGITIDEEYWKRLKNKYDNQLKKIDEKIEEELVNLKPKIDAWRLTSDANYKTSKTDKKGKVTYTKSKSEQLEDPVNMGSPTQFAILLYDILKAPVVDKKSPRGTGEEILVAIAEKSDIKLCKLLLERRGVTKLLSSYIDNIPPLLDIWKDGKIRVNFDQYGTNTGRFTSGGKIKLFRNGKKEEIPGVNLQTIPSHNKDIRMMYCGSYDKETNTNYVIVGSDYSAQEPRLTAFMSQDENMLKAYQEGKDLYAVIASLSFGVPYEECLEFHPVTGAKQVEGKERRTQAKSILLGLEYGRGAKSIGEQINKSKEEAQKIIDKFFKAFPKVKEFIDNTFTNVKKTGYVEDWYGRRRRLPNIFLPEYEFVNVNASKDSMFNPFLCCSDGVDENFEKKCAKIKKDLSKAWGSQRNEIISKAFKEGVSVKQNSNLIAEAERQSVNSIIQGGAATLTKLAMINIHNDEVLNKLGFRLLSTIHDEVFGECPEQNAQEVADRLTKVMIDTAKPYMNVPMSCDAYIVKHWYEDEYGAVIKSEYNDYLKKMSSEEALQKVIEEHMESTEETIRKIIN